MTAKEAMRIAEYRHLTAPEAYEVVHALFGAERLASALKVLSKCAKKFQIETDEKKRNGRIWDALYEAIEKADAALAEARKEKV